MPTLTFTLLAFAAGFILSYVGVYSTRLLGERFGILDVPNDRSSHTRSVPRGGGLMIVILTMLGVWIANSVQLMKGHPSLIAYTATAFLIVAISWLDDIHSQAWWLRLSVHGSAAIIAIHAYGYLQIPATFISSPMISHAVGVVATFIWIVGLTNAYNFMDGIDGIAGAQALIASVGWALTGWLRGNSQIFVLGTLVAASTLGFLFHNWPSARIFMGDVGSAFLGYTFAVLPLIFASDVRSAGSHLGLSVAALVLLWPFVFDSTFTLLRRLLAGENVFRAHRSHLYQRLVLVGYSHQFVSILYSALACAGLVFVVGWSLGFRNIPAMVSVALPLLCLGLWAFVTRSERMMKSTTAAVPRFGEPPNERQAGKRVSALTDKLLTRRVQFALDLGVLIAAFLFAYLLRFEFTIPPEWIHPMLVQLPCVVLLQFVALNLAGAHSFVWRYVGIAEVRTFLIAAISVFAVLVMIRVGLPPFVFRTWRVPLSICVMDTVLGFGGVLGLRVVRRSSYEVFEKRKRERSAQPAVKRRVLLIGAGRAGVLAAKEILNRGDLNLEIVGFIDDDPKKQRSVINRVRVLGKTDELPRLVRHLHVDHVIITIAQASRQEIQRVTKLCEEIPIKVRIIPGFYEILDGRVEISRIRDVQIEDLLGREPVQLNVDSISRELAGKVVMVTGAGGSIGSELARQVIRFSPDKLLLVERAEFALFHVDRSLREFETAKALVPLVADLSDAGRMRSIFESYRPQVVIHAAAHKHVPLMESNPCEAIKNNVLNTRLLSELAAEFEAEAFVMISTDKAVRPSSIMGASKRVAELVAQDVGRRCATRFVAVRFGNVIGSNGSAIPIFQEQIRKGGPLTITDKRMRRYFMTIPEAAQLVLQASAIGKGGEVFILHMGEPVSILELAETLISLSGLKPHHDIKIVETGIRPGEKLEEELRIETEEAVPTSHPKIFIARITRTESTVIDFALRRLTQLVHSRDDAALRDFLAEFIPDSQLNGTAEDQSEPRRVAVGLS